MNLVEKRGKVGFTQKMLAKKTGIFQASISSIEGGRSYPHAITRQKIEKVQGPVDWIATKLHGGHRHSINFKQTKS